MILPVLDGLRDYLEHTEGGLDGFRKLLIEQLGVRFGDVFGDQELTVAILVDPRFKAVLYMDEQRSKIVNWTVAMKTTANNPTSLLPSSPSVVATPSLHLCKTGTGEAHQFAHHS